MTKAMWRGWGAGFTVALLLGVLVQFPDLAAVLVGWGLSMGGMVASELWDQRHD